MMDDFRSFHAFEVKNTSGKIAHANDIGYIDQKGEYKAQTEDALCMCMVVKGGDDNEGIYVATEGHVQDLSLPAPWNLGEAKNERDERLEAEAAALREALERIERLSRGLLESMPEWTSQRPYRVIPMVVQEINDQANATLATDVGRPLLERLRRVEAERDDLQAALAGMTKIQQMIAGSVPREEW